LRSSAISPLAAGSWPADGSVFAETRADGKRVYPQEWLAGQTIGWVAPVTAKELPTLPPTSDYQVGEMLGRSGLEQGAEDLLRGLPGAVLVAERPYGEPVQILNRPTVPGAEVTISIRKDLQATAEASLRPYANAATAVVDPRSGEVWALASAPLVQPERDDPRNHAGRQAAGDAQRFGEVQQSSPGGAPGGLVVQALHPARRAQDWRGHPRDPHVLQRDLDLRRLHVPQLQGPPPRAEPCL